MTDISRRTVARGAAWSVPGIAIGTAAPAMAASPVAGLQGRVQWYEDCDAGTVSIRPYPNGTSDLYSKGGDYGFYVYNTKAKDVSGACMTFTYPSSLGKLTWKATSQNGAWGTPAFVSSSSAGNTYQSCYTGSFTDNTYVDKTNNSTYFASVTSYPSFNASIGSACVNPLNITITRTVIVSGRSITFSRAIAVTLTQ